MERIRLFSLARGFDRHDQRKEVQRRRNVAKAKATFNQYLSVFFCKHVEVVTHLVFSPKRYCFPSTLHEAFFLLLFLRPQASANAKLESVAVASFGG